MAAWKEWSLDIMCVQGLQYCAAGGVLDASLGDSLDVWGGSRPPAAQGQHASMRKQAQLLLHVSLLSNKLPGTS